MITPVPGKSWPMPSSVVMAGCRRSEAGPPRRSSKGSSCGGRGPTARLSRLALSGSPAPKGSVPRCLRPKGSRRGSERPTEGGLGTGLGGRGKLGGPGYTDRPARVRRRILSDGIPTYGYRSVLGSLQVLLRNRDIHSDTRRTIKSDIKWLKAKYGGPGSFGIRG